MGAPSDQNASQHPRHCSEQVAQVHLKRLRAPVGALRTSYSEPDLLHAHVKLYPGMLRVIRDDSHAPLLSTRLHAISYGRRPG